MELRVSGPTGVYGEIVDGLRADRKAGAPISRLVAGLRERGIDLTDVERYFRAAFMLSGRAVIAMLPKDESGEPEARILDEYIGGYVDAAAEQWQAAGPYPDLLRRRDRRAFSQVARRHEIVLVVGAAERTAAAYVGRVGYLPAASQFPGVVRGEGRNAGLFAADPGDARLDSVMHELAPGGGYEGYRAVLGRRGLTISGEAEGFVIKDVRGNAYYPGYDLHGVYRRETGENAWTLKEGPRLRAELNRRLGHDLIQSGPRDNWAERFERSETDPQAGPRPPALFFLPDGEVQVRMDARGMEQYYRFLGIDWERLYPTAMEGEEEGT